MPASTSRSSERTGTVCTASRLYRQTLAEIGATTRATGIHANPDRGSYFVEMYAYHRGSREILQWRLPTAFFEVVGSDGDSGAAAILSRSPNENRVQQWNSNQLDTYS